MSIRFPQVIMAFTGLLCLVILSAHGQETDPQTCEGPYRGQQAVSPEALQAVLSAHRKWLRNPKDPDGRQANLCDAKLTGADLKRASLRKANLRQANLRRAKLSQANLSRADLSYANLGGAAMDGANLIRTTLVRATLDRADLSNSRLNKANLKQAFLRQTKLYGANLDEANLGKADLRDADMTLVQYEPVPESLPIITYMALAKNLSRMTFRLAPQGLIELREAFKKAGVRTQEREVTYAINYAQRINSWNAGNKIESFFTYLLFELPCDYGMSPERPLIILGLLLPIFAIVYMLSLRCRGRGGIWVVWDEERVRQEEGDDKPMRITGSFYFPKIQARAADRWWGGLFRGACVVLTGIHYSTLSAFRIGWQELNIGAWIDLMEPREYELHATGWVKFLSGMQSLIGGYMVALWVLSYFGRPFG